MLNLPHIALLSLGSTLGSLFSYGTFLLLVIYYVIFLKGKPDYGILCAGLFYFIISALQSDYLPESEFIVKMLKFIFLALFGASFFKSITDKEIMLFFILGSLTVLLHLFTFPPITGRATGFYIDPNYAGCYCLLGYSMSFTPNFKKYSTYLKIFFAIAGFLTLSRTFILLWIFINIISLGITIANIKVLLVGSVLFVALIIFGSLFELGGKRFENFSAFVTQNDSASIQEGSRHETWTIFLDEIAENPFLGGGYGKFQKGGVKNVGVHNTYLLIMGEAGILALLFFLIYCIYLFKISLYVFKLNPSVLLMTITVLAYLMTLHNFFDKNLMLVLMLLISGRAITLRNIKIHI